MRLPNQCWNQSGCSSQLSHSPVRMGRRAAVGSSAWSGCGTRWRTLFSNSLAGVANRLDECLQIVLCRAEVDDTGSKHETPGQFGPGQKYVPIALNAVQYPSIEPIAIRGSL